MFVYAWFKAAHHTHLRILSKQANTLIDCVNAKTFHFSRSIKMQHTTRLHAQILKIILVLLFNPDLKIKLALGIAAAGGMYGSDDVEDPAGAVSVGNNDIASLLICYATIKSIFTNVSVAPHSPYCVHWFKAVQSHKFTNTYYRLYTHRLRQA